MTGLQSLPTVLPGGQTQNCRPVLQEPGGGHCLVSRSWEHESSEREPSSPVSDEGFQKL